MSLPRRASSAPFVADSTSAVLEPKTSLSLRELAAARVAARQARRAAQLAPLEASLDDLLEPAAQRGSNQPPDACALPEPGARLEARVPGASRALAAVAARYQQAAAWQEPFAEIAPEPRVKPMNPLPEQVLPAPTAVSVDATAEASSLDVLNSTIPLSAEELHAALDEVLTASAAAPSVHVAPRELPASASPELQALEEELAFRLDPSLDPTFAEHLLEPLPVPANLIHFPRPLVAPRKARPRLAEGPLRELSEITDDPQLSIFELEQAVIGTAAQPYAAATALPAPEWQELVLDRHPASRPEPTIEEPAATPTPAYDPSRSAIYTQPALLAPLESAPLQRRVLSTAVDGCVLLAAWTALLCMATIIAGPLLTHLGEGPLALLAVLALLVLYVTYHLLFFTFANATPGMRYAQLELCTFDGQRPARRQLRRRIAATLLAAAPLGMGLLWMMMDYDHLGWHDRLSRLYPREN